MKYYLIFLKNGKVVDISTFDDEEARDKHANRYQVPLASQEYVSWIDGSYDEVQTLNVVS